MLSAKIVFDDRYGAYFSSEGIPSIPSGSSPGCRKFNGSKGSSTRDGFLSTWVRDRFSGACSCSPRSSLIFWSSAITQHLRRHVARRSCPRSSCSLRGPCATGHRAGSPGRPGDPETRNIDTGTYHPVFLSRSPTGRGLRIRIFWAGGVCRSVPGGIGMAGNPALEYFGFLEKMHEGVME